MNKTCPKCGSGSIGDRGLLFYCGNKSTGVYETGKCIKIQRDQLLEAQNRELVDALQGVLNLLDCIYNAREDVTLAVVSDARAILAKHKEAKP